MTTPREILLARRQAILADLDLIETDLDQTPPKDWEDRASERQGDEVLEALGNSELLELRRIDAALDRVKAGTYGECVKCGEEISAARLAAVPDTPFCNTCAS